MADSFSKAERSAIMQRIKSKCNKTTEQTLVNLFRANNITGWRRNYPVKGKPDFVFLERKIAVFADGCFWHGHDCRNITPKQNRTYWQKKRQKNKKRDILVNQLFVSRGWTVVRFWECAIKTGAINLKTLFKNE
jgi:DNA mismatch endonuclease (patch repair protein)